MVRKPSAVMSDHWVAEANASDNAWTTCGPRSPSSPPVPCSRSPLMTHPRNCGWRQQVRRLIRFKADASEPPGGAVGEPRGEGRTGNSDADRGADLPNRTLGRGALPGGVGGHIVEHGTRQLGGGEPQAEPVDREQSGEGERGGIGVEDEERREDPDDFQSQADEDEHGRAEPGREVPGARTGDEGPAAMPASTKPAPIVVSPSALTRNSGSTNTSANSPIATVVAVMLPQLKVGIRNRSRSRSAERPTRARWRSQNTKSTSEPAPRSRKIGTTEIARVAGHVRPNTEKSCRGFHHPRSAPSMIANTSAPSPMTLSWSPSTSTPLPPARPREFGTKMKAATIRMTARGTLMRKIHSQE